MNLDWKNVPPAEAVGIVATVNPYLQQYGLSPDSCAVRVTKLPFYRNFIFYELTDAREAKPKSMFALQGEADGERATYVMDWTNRPIYTVNEFDLVLDHANLAEYLFFFFACVQGPYGPMTVVENLDTPESSNPDVYYRAEVLDRFTPPKIVGRTIGGGYVVKAGMFFKDCIFLTQMNVGRNGYIQIVDHVLMIGSLAEPSA